MTRIVVTDRDGQARELDAYTERALMETLREMDDGVAAMCGGMCSCATCHVYVHPDWLDRLPPADLDELDLLDGLEFRRDNSRLSCQIPFTEALAGLAVTLAPEE